MLRLLMPLAVGLARAPVSPGADSPRRLDIESSGDPAGRCADATSVRELIASTLGRTIETPSGSATADASVRIDGRELEGEWTAHIEIVGTAGTRRERTITVEVARCEERLGAVALVAALLLDEVWLEERTITVPPPPPAVAGPPPPTERGPGWAMFTGLGGVFAYQDLPAATGGLTLHTFAAAPRVISLGLAVTALPRRAIEDATGAGARFSAYDLGVGLCARFFERARADLAGCASVRAGLVHVVGEGLAGTGGAVRPRVLAQFELRARRQLAGPLWGALGLGAGIPIAVDDFVYDRESGERVVLHRSWPVFPVALLALELRSEIAGGKPRRRSENRASADTPVPARASERRAL